MKEKKYNQNKTVLITGTTSGIGYEFSHVFAREGYSLILVSRDAEKLEKQQSEMTGKYGVDVRIIAKDLADPDAPEKIFSEIKSKNLHVDILVNNAGFNEAGAFSETDLKKELAMLQVNMVALTHLTKLFLPGMLEKKFGKILNLGSTGSFTPCCPYDAAYCATKAYVLSFSNGIRVELKGTGVSVTALCPGATETEFARKANIENTKLFSSSVMEARKVAEIGYKALMKNKKVVVPGFSNKMMVASIPFTPGFILDNISATLLKRR